ncbi:hypothetical protein B0H19DRAFT_1275541 [Mycena capillaripes]|nr:hypothetical protein B0H19DRAFT_1275541 [Mycena capillaripes]
MPLFKKTVSQLTRAELLLALGEFDIEDISGNISALRTRLKAHLAANEDLMDNPDYISLFSREQRTRYAEYPPAWGGIGDDDEDDHPPVSDHGSDDSGADDNPPSSALPEHDAKLQLLSLLPAAMLEKALGSIFNAGAGGNTELDHTSSPRAHSASRKRPTVVRGLAASNTGHLIPEAIRKKFTGADGWKSHVPLQHLTDKYCQNVRYMGWSGRVDPTR